MKDKIQPIEYLKHHAVKLLLESHGQTFQKNGFTELRTPGIDEVGHILPTFVKDGDGIRQESSSVIKPYDVVARNPLPIGRGSDGEDIYNEWPIPSETARQNYGEDIFTKLGKNFTAHRKIATIKAIELTTELMATLEQISEQGELHIKVNWSAEPMIAKVGDYLTSGGYSISRHDMTAYSQVGSEKHEIVTPKPVDDVNSENTGLSC